MDLASDHGLLDEFKQVVLALKNMQRDTSCIYRGVLTPKPPSKRGKQLREEAGSCFKTVDVDSLSGAVTVYF